MVIITLLNEAIKSLNTEQVIQMWSPIVWLITERSVHVVANYMINYRTLSIFVDGTGEAGAFILHSPSKLSIAINFGIKI